MGGLLGGLLSGALLYATGTGQLRLVLLGSVLGTTSVAGGFVVWLLLSFVLAGVFGTLAEDRFDVGEDVATDATYGLGYGAAVAILLGMVVVPALAGADVPAVNTTGIVAYLLFGVVTAVGYGAVLRNEVPDVSVGGEDLQAAAAGSLLGGVAAGAVFYATAKGFLYQLGLIAGLGRDPTGGFLVWLVVALALGALFRRVAAPMVGRGEDELRGYARVGLVYGATLGIVVGMVLVPVVVGASSGASPSVPYVNGTMLVGFLLYGLLLGVGYAWVSGESTTLPAGVGGRFGPALPAAVAGGVVGLVAIRVAVGQVYFLYLGLTAGLGSGLTAGYVVWLALAAVLAWVFVRFGTAEEPVSVTRSSLRRGLAFGAIVGGAMIVLLPVMYEASTGNTYASAGSNLQVFVSYVLFGGAVGAGHGLGEEGAHLPALGTPVQRAVAFGSLFGAFTGGLVIHQLGGSLWMLYFGAIAGSFSYLGAWLVWIAVAGAMGAGFWYGLARNLDAYVEDMHDAAGSEGTLDRALEAAELTTTATVLGTVYGVVVAVVVGMILVPVAVTAATAHSMSLPTTEPMVLAGYVVYGTFLGLGYGTILEF